METKQTPPVGLPTFNDPNRYGEQIITQGQFPEGGMSSGGGGTEIQSFDFPTPDTNPSNKALDPLDQVKAERKAKRRGKRAVNKANRFNKRNPNNKINVPGQTPALTPPPAQQSSLPNSISGQQQAGSSPSYDENANQGGSSYYPGMGNNVGSGNSSLNMMDQQYDQQSPQSPQGTVPMQNLMPDQTAMSYQPPMPGNTQGTAKPLFNQGTANAAQQIYGSEEQRQQSVPGAPLYMHRGTPHKRDDGKGSNSSKKIPDFSGLIPPRNDGDDASLFGGIKRLIGVDDYVNSRYPTNQPYVEPNKTNTSVLERFKTNKAPLNMHHDTGQFASMLGAGGEVASTKNITKKVLRKDKLNVSYDQFVSDQGNLTPGSESPYAGITHNEISKNTFPHHKSKQFITDSIVGKINSGEPFKNFSDHKMIGSYRMGYGGKQTKPPTNKQN